jgi:hypothetical protein
MKRPDIATITSGAELKEWYWLKAELIEYCKIKSINYSGGKFTILERIGGVIDGKSIHLKDLQTKISKFNWAKENLSLNTVITDSYTNGSNVRKFFQSHCGNKFHFSIPFMNWIKANIGKTLQDAVSEWNRLQILAKDKNYQSKIPVHNQYNQYMRDFFADNPDKTIKEARYFWNLKKQLSLSLHKYERSDLELK